MKGIQAGILSDCEGVSEGRGKPSLAVKQLAAGIMQAYGSNDESNTGLELEKRLSRAIANNQYIKTTDSSGEKATNDSSSSVTPIRQEGDKVVTYLDIKDIDKGKDVACMNKDRNFMRY